MEVLTMVSSLMNPQLTLGGPPVLRFLTDVVSYILLLSVLYVLGDYIRILRLRQKLPPGPFPWPLVGNHFQVKLPRPWLWMDEQSKKYNSSPITIWRGHRPMIFFHDAWSISEILDKRSNIYSSRPEMTMLGDSRDATAYDQAVLPYGDMWRHHRRLMHNVVGSQAVRNHQPIQDNEIKILIGDLLDRPDDYVKAIERYSVSVVSSVGFGRRIDKMDDTVAKVALKFMEGVDMAIPGLFIMESIPFLLNLPKIVYPLAMTMKDSSAQLKAFFTALAHEGASESSLPNFSTSLIQEQKESNLSDNEIAFLTGNLIGGGVDTTASTTLSFIFAMCAFPDVQRKAFEEIDRVVGQSRMPDWIDKENLPYCAAIVSESLRWRTVTILGGIPHAPIQDDMYEGYTIPKGTWIAGNVWSIHRNEQDFPEPDQFDPDRFLEDRRPFPNKKGHSAFGWGRRQCSGQPLAEQGLFLTLARLIWSFEMRPALMQDGREEKLDIFAFSESENMRPEPFGVRFIPRNEERAESIHHEVKAARDYLTPLNRPSSVAKPPFV